MDSFSNEAGKGCITFVVLVIALCISIAICDYNRKKNNNIIDCISVIVGKHYHIKNNNIIEQDIELQKHNDSLKFKVNNLDSIKNAKVLEVEVLDDDSTINLFYNLIK